MSYFRCIKCGASFEPQYKMICDCGGLFEVIHDFQQVHLDIFDKRLGKATNTYKSGVWRYKELIHPTISVKNIVTRPEGNTNLYANQKLSEYAGIKNLSLKHEGENPTGSFKDRGMTVAVSEALAQGANRVACASTGNTSASMAAYAAQAGLNGVVFVPEGGIAYGKLAQALAYGSKVLQIKGNFDTAMKKVREGAKLLGYYILNSINPWRIEGQKSIMFELLQQREWSPPDWIILPAGNLGNTSAFGKAFMELKELKLIQKIPQIASIQAEGANPFYQLWRGKELEISPMKPDTVASAIKIGNPVSWEKAIKVIKETNGVVEQVTDSEILNAKAVVDHCGIGCEPASAAAVAGAKKLAEKGIIKRFDTVVCILTGNLLKDPDTTVKYHMGELSHYNPLFINSPITVEPDLDEIEKTLTI
jgi:threonine synthase